jgi:hypothetical protein
MTGAGGGCVCYFGGFTNGANTVIFYMRRRCEVEGSELPIAPGQPAGR